MRIVQIGPYPLSKDCIHGGVEASVYGLTQELVRTNEVHVFDFPRIDGLDEIESDGNTLIHRFQNKGKRQMSMTSQVKRIADEIEHLKPSVCHIHGTGLYSRVLYQALKQRGLRVIVTVHGLVMVEKLNALKKHFGLKLLAQFLYQSWSEIRLLAQLPIAIVDTEYVKEKVDRYPIHNKPRMCVIPQGVNEAFFSLQCSNKTRTLLSIGAIGERKGHLLTLKAYEIVCRQGIEANLVIAGAIADSNYLKQLQSAIEESEFKNEITLHLNVPNETLKRLYENAHLFVLHTQEESQGIVFGEAMATGLPIVTTQVGGVPFVVQDGVTGLLSKYGDVNAFAHNIMSLLNDDLRWAALSEASRSLACNYHWAVVGKKVLELYCDL